MEGSPKEADGRRRVTPERRGPERVRRCAPPHPLGGAASAHFSQPMFAGWPQLAPQASVAAIRCFEFRLEAFIAGHIHSIFPRSPSANADMRRLPLMALFQGSALACRRGEALIFEAVDFALQPGDALWLSGPNGSGKSTLLRVMAGLLAPVHGTLAWSGRPIGEDREAHRGRLRYLGHLDAVKTHLTVAENLAFWGAYWGTPTSAVAAAMARLGIAQLSAAPARQLSAGQRRRLALARLALG